MESTNLQNELIGVMAYRGLVMILSLKEFDEFSWFKIFDSILQTMLKIKKFYQD